MTRIGTIILCGALLAGAVWMAGCAGDTDDRYRPSTTKLLEIYLQVARADGTPLEGATVWVDGTAERHTTGDSYLRLDSQFPPDWRGWQYNWFGGPFRFDARDFPARGANIEILVSKDGWRTARSTINISRDAPDDLFMRQTFVMERSGVGTAGVGTAEEDIFDVTDPAEVVSLTDPAWSP